MSRQPRGWLVDPKQFGRVLAPAWLRDQVRTAGDRIDLTTSQMQHQVAYFVHTERHHHGWRTWQQVADAARLPVDVRQLAAIMRGERVMGLHYIAAFSLAMGRPIAAFGYTLTRPADGRA